MFVFQGNRVVAAREAVGICTIGSTLKNASLRDFIAYFAKSAAVAYGELDESD